MRRTRSLGLVGGALLLGPLVYALTLPGPRINVPVVIAEAEVCPEVPVVEPAEPAPVVEPAEPAPAPEPEPKVAPALTPDDLAQRSPMLLIQSGALILDTEAKAGWARGRISEPPGDDDHFRASKPIVPKAIPAAHWAQRGRSFDVYGREGKRCTARVGELRVMAQYVGPTVDDLFGYDENRDYGELPAPIAEVRAEVWKTQPHWLTAELIPEGDCDLATALWARDAALPAPVVLTPSQAENPKARKRLREFAASAELTETRERYEDYLATLDPELREYQLDWTTLARQSPAEVTSWLDAEGLPRLLELDFGLDSESCGEGFDARLTHFDRVTESGFEDFARAVGPAAIVDADLDGKFEVLYVDDEDSWSASVHSETLHLWADIDRDWYCPC